MGRVSYDGQRLIPAPFVGINKSYNFAENGEKLGQTYQITLNGSLVTGKGSPAASGLYNGGSYPPDETLTQNQRLTNLNRKQEYIRQLFKNDGRWLEIQGDDGAAPVKFQPIINSIDFEPDVWVDQTRYSIQMSTDRMWGATEPEDTNSNLSAATESWQLDYDEQNDTYNVSHSLSAQARPIYTSGTLVSDLWLTAKNWVTQRLGQNDVYLVSSGALYLKDTYFSGGPINLYNHVRSEQIGKLDNSYAVTETWLASNKPYTEEYTVTLQLNLDGPDQVNVEGTIQGYLIRNTSMGVTTNKYTSANQAWNSVSGVLYTRALNMSSLSYLNPIPLSRSIGKNEKQGLVTYNYNYDTRSVNCITGAKYENITISDTNQGKIIAVIPVLGRTKGPVLQDIGTYNEKRRQISIEAVMQGSFSDCNAKLTQSKPNVDAIITALTPAGKTYKTADNETFDLSNSRYTKTVEFIYESS